MANLALYRRYRPKRFGEVQGQEHIVSVLRRETAEDAPAHAYLFTGPRGTGKTSTARILAMALNCENPQDGEPCLACDNCLAALSDAMVDIIEIDAASNNSVDNAREIRDRVNLLPARGKYKVYIIDEVHMLSTSAFNALLKTLEEPPRYSVFILATTDLRKLPATVLSRCQRFDFKRIDEGTMVASMQGILKELGIPWEDEALLTIARAAEGGMRDALSILDKCCAAGGEITYKMVAELLGLSDIEKSRALMDAIGCFDAARALKLLDEIYEDGAQPATLVSELMQGLRDRMIKQAGKGEAEEARQLVRAIEILSDAENKMRFSARASIVLEAALMKILLPGTDKGSPELELRMKSMEERAERAESEMREVSRKLSELEKGGGAAFSIEDIMASNGIEVIE